MIAALKLSPCLLQEMVTYVEGQLPWEACGLLAGQADRAEIMIGVPSEARSPVRFRMEPRAQLQALDWIDSHDLELVGIFHSHPNGPESVSPTDIEEAAYPVVHLVLSPQGGGWQARGFWIEAGVAREVPLQVEGRSNPASSSVF